MDPNLIHGLSFWDWFVIGFYFVFIIGIGFLFKHLNKNASDYFRGGGNMTWWMAGVSAMVGGLSAWTFTGGAAKIYQDGFVLPLSWIIGVPITFPIAWFIVPRFRQMRVVTSIEAVFRRFGFGTEQFYTYLILPMGVFWGGIGLNTISVFMSAALGIDMRLTLLGLGIIVTVMASAGGQWAVAASDFVQGLVMFLIVFVVAWFSINLPEIGGITHLLENLPERHTNFTIGARGSLVLLWFGFIQFSNILGTIDMHGNGAKYLLVKDGRSARGMLLLNLVWTILIPTIIIIQLPALCAATVYPDLGAVFPNLQVPEEGAFVAMAYRTLPNGLIGVLLVGMFAASMSSMDTALNRNAGYFIRNVYIRVINKVASEEKQVGMGRVVTLVFGSLMIIIGMSFNQIREANLFDVFQVLNSMLMLPTVIPVALGMIFKRTPGWSGWTTVLAGLMAGAVGRMTFTPERFQAIMGYTEALSHRELMDAQFIYISGIVLVVSFTWFFASYFLYPYSRPETKERVEAFFKDMRTPIDHVKEEVKNQDAMQYRLVGITCLVFGGFLLLGILIPNPLHGRMSFLFVGGVIFLMGVLLYVIGQRKYKLDPNAER